MTTFQKVKLGDVADVIPGFAFKSSDFSDSGKLILKIKNIQSDFSISLENCDYVKNEVFENKNFNKYKIAPKEALIAMTGATIGKVGRFTNKIEVYLNQRVALFRSKKINNDYLWALLRSPKYQDILKGLGNGAAQANMSSFQIEKIEINLPDFSIQIQIASILSTYDDLIEKNEKRIKALEEMAQLLYIEWFVKPVKNGLPKGWEIKKLEDVSDVLFGYNFKSSSFNEKNEGVRVVRIRDVLSGNTETFTPEITDKKYLIEKGDLLIGMDGIFHMSMWFMEGCFLNQRVVRIRSEKLPASFIYESIKKQLYFFQKTIVGATVGHLSNGNIRDFKIFIPNNDSMIKIFQEITNLTIILKLQNQNLSKTRDLLIPRLVTGKRELK